jgi:hypothetical protein
VFEEQLKAEGIKRSVAIDIKEWFCKKNGIKGKTHIVKILKETDKALLVNFCFDYYIDMWLPKSVITLTIQYQWSEEEKQNLYKEWIAMGKDLEELNNLLKFREKKEND